MNYRKFIGSLTLLFLCTSQLLGQSVKVPDGIYYITQGNWYLWPAETTNTKGANPTGYRYVTTFNAPSAPAATVEGISYPARDSSYSHWVVKNNDDGTITLINPKLNQRIEVQPWPKQAVTAGRKVSDYGDRDIWLVPYDNTPEGYERLELNNDKSPYKISPGPNVNNTPVPSNRNSLTFNSAAGDKVSLLGIDANGEIRTGHIQFYADSPTWTFTEDKLPAPVIDFNEGASCFSISYDLAEGFDILYTTDGTEPTVGGTSTRKCKNREFVTVAGEYDVKAVVARYDVVLTQMATQHVYATNIVPDAPTISISDDCERSVSMSVPAGIIFYTLDGSAPISSSTQYTAPFTPEEDVTIKAISVIGNNYSDAITTVDYKTSTPMPTIVVTKPTVTITGRGMLYYTLDGSAPTSSSTQYTAPFTLPNTDAVITVKAIAVEEGRPTSCVAETDILPPYLISDVAGLNGLANHLSADCFILADIDASGFVASIEGFTGTIDGGMHTISGLSHPLFTEITDAEVKNLFFSDVKITEDGNAGVLAGSAVGASRIYNCGVLSGSIEGTANVGGLVGQIGGTARVINCFSFADVGGGNWTAGIVGYNNFASTTTDIRTMVMNCMMYGDVTSGTNTAPVYGGVMIDNDQSNDGLNNYNYFSFDDLKGSITAYNCALGAERRYLTRFEFYRYLLNSNRELAAWYATGSTADAHNVMAKWVLNRSVAPYPVLKVQEKYPSIVNTAKAQPATGLTEKPTLSVTIKKTEGDGASVHSYALTKTSLTLPITDMEEENFDFNYHKVQLPYYNDVGTNNYTGRRVVTGWKIVSVTGGTEGEFTTGVDAPAYNFADRFCTKKDRYDVSGRVFAQGAYYDVPEGVTAITIEPYWAQCVYLSDPYYDVTYNNSYVRKDVTSMGVRFENGKGVPVNGTSQKVYTNMNNALQALAPSESGTVYDYAVVLVGNYHHYYGAGQIATGNTPFTVMSADLDFDNEPDYSFIYQHTNRREISPIRFDFLNWPGIGLAQKVSTSSRMPDQGIFQPNGWFEVTNTCLVHIYQFEYDKNAKKDAPLILLGGSYEQIVSTNDSNPTHTQYIHLGGNAWFKMFNNGSHGKTNDFTPHRPISVTGGDYDRFYLTGMFIEGNKTEKADNAECYISGGRFGEVAATGIEKLDGDVTWQIYGADIANFYGGGINAVKPITGNINIDIRKSNVGTFCGGPKFGDMTAGKTVVTKAKDCTFGTFFGAGYGGTSLNSHRTKDLSNSTNYNFNSWATSDYNRKYNATYGGIAASYEYEFMPYSGFGDNNNVGRFYINYASLSLATTRNVTSTLSGCTIEHDFYGGGNLGLVDGDVTSTLTDCTVTGNIFGGGFSAEPPTADVFPVASFVVAPSYDGKTGVYTQGVYPAAVTYTWHQVSEVKNGSEFDEANKYILTTVDMSKLGQVTGQTSLTISGNTRVEGLVDGIKSGGVYGGGDASDVLGDVALLIEDGVVEHNAYGGGNKADVAGNVSVKVTGGTIEGELYGGGALADTNTKKGTNTTVELLGGTVNDVYGGALGDENNAAIVFGNVNVELNEGVTETEKGCVVKGSIFGCNNVNGTPKGLVTVHVYATQKAGEAKISDKSVIGTDTYDVAAVYGGGNQSAYEPDASDGTTHVIIEGCGLTSIGSVYGGGNAASSPATHVEVHGTYEIDYLFGGGNGAGAGNPGANVGYYPDPDIEDPRTPGAAYGTGVAQTEIWGGLIHHVFGGSNTRGNIRDSAVSMLDESDGKENCPILVDELFGGGNEAFMDGDLLLELGCISSIDELYGGAKSADIKSDINLIITNGTFKRVFGGNMKSGNIDGSITIKVMETGCKQIRIGELYGCGNEAAYTTPKGKEDPTIYIFSATEIGTIYGGGLGETAVVTGNPHININMEPGILFSNDDVEGVDTKGNNEEQPLGQIDTVFGGGNAAKVVGNTLVEVGTTAGKSAVITGNVYGGGNKADVTGDTRVKIGP